MQSVNASVLSFRRLALAVGVLPCDKKAVSGTAIIAVHSPSRETARPEATFSCYFLFSNQVVNAASQALSGLSSNASVAERTLVSSASIFPMDVDEEM